MPKDKKQKSKKNSQLIIRLNKVEKDNFLQLCDDLDTSAAREIRRFMREFVADRENQNPESE